MVFWNNKGNVVALINCKECYKEFSDLAPSCPKCGAPTSYSVNNFPFLDSPPIPKKKKFFGFWGWIIVFVILFIALAVSKEVTQDSSNKPEQERVENNQNKDNASTGDKSILKSLADGEGMPSSNAKSEGSSPVTPGDISRAKNFIAQYAETQGWTYQEALDKTDLDLLSEISVMAAMSRIHNWTGIDKKIFKFIELATHPYAPSSKTQVTRAILNEQSTTEAIDPELNDDQIQTSIEAEQIDREKAE
jgi:hypothetical protein